MAETIAEFMNDQRETLRRMRDGLVGEQNGIAAEIATVDRELAAIDAYEQAKAGKPQQRQRTAPARGNGERQARRGSKRQAIIDMLEMATAPLSRGQLLEALDVKGDKSGEMSVSNALTALIKAGAIARAGGKYVKPSAVH